MNDEDVSPHLGVLIGTRDDWEQLKPILEEERRQRWLRRSRLQLQKLIRRDLISEWVRENLPSEEGSLLESEIESFVNQDRREDLREYLTDVLKEGTREARKKRRRKNWGNGGYLGHTWELLKGLARIAIVLAVLSAAKTRFETIVLAMLVMIYYAQQNSAWSRFQQIRSVALGIDNDFKRIRKLMHEDLDETSRELEHETNEKISEEVNRDAIRAWILLISLWIVWLIAIVRLMMAIFL